MWKRVKAFEANLFQRMWRRPAAGMLESCGWRSGLLMVAATLCAIAFGSSFFAGLAWLCGLIWGWCAVALLIRWILSRILWTVRSRLIVTCLLMGMAPIVLFGTLTSTAAYLFCGQFATNIAIEGIKDSAAAIEDRSRGVLAQVLQGKPAAVERVEDGFGLAWRDGQLMNSEPREMSAPFRAGPLPPWVKPGFRGVIGASGRLFVCGTAGGPVSGHAVVAMACSPFRKEEVSSLAEGLGEISVTPNLSEQTMLPPAPAEEPMERAAQPSQPNDAVAPGDAALPRHGRHAHGEPADAPESSAWVQGGKLSARVSSLDVPVYFSAPLKTTAWQSGEALDTFVNVVSRPSTLYQRLFANSLSAGKWVYWTLIVTAGFFGAVELMAFSLAVLVSRTITRSVSDLYLATQEIDRGNLEHLIPVRRKDQLSALAGSFNRMTLSLRALLEQQREKQRMESELKVAQEVQRNLFPHTSIALPGFEVYGVCEPARTIGGDYYDFIPFAGTQLYLSLGDISGKGISAALLMASLHSAVRAYRAGDGGEVSGGDADFDASVSPGKLLALLNRHLYTSTQPAKYATLFLASYDGLTRRLTYSNGGHPPPILLCADGSFKRLECGGSVVGLLDGMVYEEETLELQRGDVLMMYSDGLSEPERNEEDFGEARLIEVVRRNQILGLADIAARTLSAVREWIGDEEQPDDMTLVLARLG